MKYLLIVMLCLAISPSFAKGLENKKLIEYGWDVPNTAFVRQNISEMEKVPFDGVVIRVSTDGTKKHGDYGWLPFSKDRFKMEELAQAIEDLKATKFKRFTDNFIQVISMPGDIYWFDPDWAAVAHNAKCLARVAKLGGCKGIMFDPEMYGEYPIWNYTKLPKEFKAQHSFLEISAKVKERGKEFIRAINEEYPDITILSLYGPSLPYLQAKGTQLENADYALLVAFFDGMCEAAHPKTTIVEGFETSYPYRKLKEFKEGRNIMARASKLSSNPAALKKTLRTGFASWVDYNSASVVWHTDDLSKNYFSPAGFRAALNYALTESDKYVWVYSERTKWWDGDYVKPYPITPKPYWDALTLAKKGAGPGEKNPIQFEIKLEAEKLPGYSDEATFAEMHKTMTGLMDFPKDGWRWSRDPKDSGQKNGWYLKNFNDSKWGILSIGKFWEQQGKQYDGFAWYRIKFTSPRIEDGKKVFLAVGAADESAWVWLNGKLVGKHIDGWDIPFALDITKAVKQGENTLAIKVLDKMMVGGLWKSIKLMTK